MKWKSIYKIHKNFPPNNTLYICTYGIVISLALVQFLIIVLYPFLTYTCNYDAVAELYSLWKDTMRPFGNEPLEDHF